MVLYKLSGLVKTILHNLANLSLLKTTKTTKTT